MNLLALPSPKLTRAADGPYPYYAGYSLEFARSALRFLRHPLPILDPFNGSGTTMAAALEVGWTTTGYDLNPFACTVAAARLASTDQVAKGLSLDCGSLGEADPNGLVQWLDETVACEVASLRRVILAHSNDPTQPWRDPTTSAALVALARAVRPLRKLKNGSNPTWPRPGKAPRPGAGVVGLFRKELEILRQRALPSRLGQCSIEVADARHLPLPNSSIGAIVTSPPYCTRMDYAISTSFELALLGMEEKSPTFRALRENMTGTPTIRRALAPSVSLAPAVQELLERVKTHGSYESAGYYYKQLWQYFLDTTRFLMEARRVLVRGGKALVVVQSSYFKDIHIDLPSLWSQMADDVGFLTADGPSFPVRRVLADINPKTPRGRTYREAVVSMELAE